jgi:hypothetical protein
VAFGVLLARDIFNRPAHHGGTLFYLEFRLSAISGRFSEKNGEIAMADIGTETQTFHLERASREVWAARGYFLALLPGAQAITPPRRKKC